MAPVKRDLAPRSGRWAADGRTHPGKDFSHSVPLCGLGLCDCPVLRLLQHSGMQVFPLVLLPASESLGCGWSQRRVLRVLWALLASRVFIAVFAFSERLVVVIFLDL